MPLLVVDPWDWLDEDGHFLFDNPRLYRRMRRVARFIEYGGLLKKNETLETLIECKRRPKGKPCHGLMWVVKMEDDGILAHCLTCKTEEALVHNWQETEWASGPMEAVPVAFDTEGRTSSTMSPASSSSWVSHQRKDAAPRAAAESLDMAASALRRTIERRARLAGDGVLEAVFDGILARKFAGRWRVNLGPAWTREGAANDTRKNNGARAIFSPRPEHATRPETE